MRCDRCFLPIDVPHPDHQTCIYELRTHLCAARLELALLREQIRCSSPSIQDRLIGTLRRVIALANRAPWLLPSRISRAATRT